MKKNQPWLARWWVLLAILVQNGICRQEDERTQFLYLDNPAAENVVRDYQHHMHDPHDQRVEETDAVHATDPRPFFLRNTYPAHRVVEFYSPWCGHCQTFAARYIQTAQEVLRRVQSSSAAPVEFYAVSCSEHHHLCQENNIRSYPVIRAFAAHSENPIPLEIFTLKTIDQALNLGIHISIAQPEVSVGVESATMGLAMGEPRQDEHVTKLDILGATMNNMRRTRTDVYKDAALSFTHSLEHHIYADDQQSLTPEQAAAFSEWLDLLYWTLPPTWMLHALINDLRQNINNVVQSKRALLQIVEMHYGVVHESSNRNVQWSNTCRRKGDEEGFSCGLWCLFHIMSIGVSERHRAVLGGRDRVSTKHAAKTLRDYVEHFGSWCPECRDEFIRSFDSCAYNRCRRFRQFTSGKKPPAETSWKEFPIWVWQVHNGINEQIVSNTIWSEHRRKATSTLLAAARWPSKSSCPSCSNARGRWDEEQVLSSLKDEYWPGGILNFRYVVLDKKNGTQDESRETSSERLLYSGILLLLALLAYAFSRFNRRLQLRKTGYHKKYDPPHHPPHRHKI